MAKLVVLKNMEESKVLAKTAVYVPNTAEALEKFKDPTSKDADYIINNYLIAVVIQCLNKYYITEFHDFMEYGYLQFSRIVVDMGNMFIEDSYAPPVIANVLIYFSEYAGIETQKTMSLSGERLTTLPEGDFGGAGYSTTCHIQGLYLLPKACTYELE